MNHKKASLFHKFFYHFYISPLFCTDHISPIDILRILSIIVIGTNVLIIYKSDLKHEVQNSIRFCASCFIILSSSKELIAIISEQNICGNCKTSFDDPHTCHDNPYGIYGGDESWEACPKCGSQNYSLASICTVCKGKMPYPKDGIFLCDECRHAAAEFFRLYLKKWFSKEEILYLDSVYDGIDLGIGIS